MPNLLFTGILAAYSGQSSTYSHIRLTTPDSRLYHRGVSRGSVYPLPHTQRSGQLSGGRANSAQESME